MGKKVTEKSKHSVVKEDDPVDEPIFIQGSQRLFLDTEPSAKNLNRRQLTSNEYIYIGILILLSVYVRLGKLSTPDSVVFDEVHFGKFAKKYITGSFFLDVHPPLAKMLFAAVGLLGGFKGDFDFTAIGDKYPETVPYVVMRSFPAILGIGTIILCYLTLRLSGCRPIVCLVTSFLLLIENANVTISRYILLDSPLLFFIAASVYAFKKFEIQKPFSCKWYKSLTACGIALGLSLSSKWVGLFTITWCGIGCVYQMWFLIGDLNVAPKRIANHAIIRGSFLLGIPVILYLTFFAVHFQILNKDSDGSSFMSSAFRAGLKGNTIPTNIEANVGLGSIVSIRHLETKGGYLHSHNSFYPAGSKQQQVTLYPHLDSNNDWLIEPYNDTITDSFVPLHDGIKIRLKHVNTGRRLHSHDEKPPVSERDWQKEVSCYGYEGFQGDANDDFIVEIVQKRTKNAASKSNVKALTTIFRLRHAMTGNYLFAGSNKLPSWGFDQAEVTCASQGARPLTYFYIETNDNFRVPSNISEIVNYPTLSFWDKFVESHATMWRVNSGLTDFHPWQSNPTEWPLLLRGISYWAKDNRNVYFLGNAPTWWASTFCLIFTVVYLAVQILRWQLGAKIAGEKHIYNFNYQIFSYFVGWLVHYFPFFIMGRQLFLHHYIPSVYFAILVLGHFFDILISYWSKNSVIVKQLSYLIMVVVTALSSIFYLNYAPLISGQPWTKHQCSSTKILKWDYDCNHYFANYEDYANAASSLSNSQSTKGPLPNINADPNAVKETPYTPIDKQEVMKGNPEVQKDSSSKEPEMKEQVEEQIVPPLPDEETKKD